MITLKSYAPIDQLRLVTLCYRYVYLRQRQRLGSKLTRAERIIFGVLQRTLEGDPEDHRRRHRRMHLQMPAQLKVGNMRLQGVVQNISGGGMYVTTAQRIARGKSVQVRIGQGEETEYIFSCTVERQAGTDDRPAVGLSFIGVPLELRHGIQQQACA